MIKDVGRPFEPAMAMQSKKALNVFIHDMCKISEEIAQFTRRRIEMDVAVLNRMPKSKTFHDAWLCQHQFIDTAIKQYVNEFNCLGHMMIDMTNHVLAASREQSA